MAKDGNLPQDEQPAGVTRDQTDTSEVTQTPGADLGDQPVPTPDKAASNDPNPPAPYTEVRDVTTGEVKSTQPANRSAVDAPAKGRRRNTAD